LVRLGKCCRLVGGTPTRAVETTALPIFNGIVPLSLWLLRIFVAIKSRL
jgi:hypothetical protein